MYGWINDAIEKLIISRYGESVWITIKKLAQCDIEVNQWVINREYPDYLTDNLITSACNYLGDRVSNRDNLLVEVGEFFLTYVRYDNAGIRPTIPILVVTCSTYEHFCILINLLCTLRMNHTSQEKGLRSYDALPGRYLQGMAI
jgi:hypothetical protein